MGIGKDKAYVELTEENYKGIKKIAKESGLASREVVDSILQCELDIIEYAAWKREKLAKRLKIEPTPRFLFHRTLLDQL